MKYLDNLINEITIKQKLEKERKKVNTKPSEKQKESGNYTKGHININGFEITIENPKGSYRKGVDSNGKEWKIKMNNDYGYFLKSIGYDGDHIDVFLGNDFDSKKIFVVDQKINGKFDESKVMFGFKTSNEAKKAYLSNYEKNWKGFHKITEVDEETFKTWLYDGKKQRKAFSEYKDIKLNETRKMKVIIKESQLKNYIKKIVSETVKKHNSIYDTVFVSYGTDSFSEENFKIPVMSGEINKPHGGFWGSPIDSKYGWGKWCDENDFYTEKLSQHVLFKVKKGAKIYIIDTKEDLDNISKYEDNEDIINDIKNRWKISYSEALKIYNQSNLSKSYSKKIINFDYLYKHYDGIFVTDNAVSALRHVRDGIGLYTWDVESICIFRPEAMEIVNENAFEKATVPTFEEPDSDDDREYHYDIEERDRIKKQKQINKTYELYGNRNINSDSSNLFNGEHPGILAQGHGNNKKTKLARKYNGTVKSGL